MCSCILCNMRFPQSAADQLPPKPWTIKAGGPLLPERWYRIR